MDRVIKGRMIEGMKHMVLPGMIALSLLLAACSSKERARATRNADPEITNVDTNEIANVDYRKRMKDRRENTPEDEKVFALRQRIYRFQLEIGRVPTNLHELIKHQYVTDLPKAPPGKKYVYDPERGNLYQVFVDPTKEQAVKEADAKDTSFLSL